MYVLHDVAADCLTCDGRVITDLGEFLRRHQVDTVVNQNGFASGLTEEIRGSNWQGKYVVCYHSEPRFFRKLFGLRRVLSEVLSTENNGLVRLAWFLRLCSYPLWRRWSDRRLMKTQEANYVECDSYVLLSPSFVPQLAKLMRRKSLPKVVAIPNPLSFDSDRLTENVVKAKEVLVLARLNDNEKRISSALAAWRLIENQGHDGWVLKVVGEGPDAQALERKAQRLGLKHVHFLGHQADPLPLYESASIFLMTSRVEGWGLTLTEAMQTGAVPVAFDAYASLRDIIEHGKNGIIVQNGDHVELARETRRLMEHFTSRRLLAANAKQTAQRYRLERILDRWTRVL